MTSDRVANVLTSGMNNPNVSPTSERHKFQDLTREIEPAIWKTLQNMERIDDSDRVLAILHDNAASLDQLLARRVETGVDEKSLNPDENDIFGRFQGSNRIPLPPEIFSILSQTDQGNIEPLLPTVAFLKAVHEIIREPTGPDRYSRIGSLLGEMFPDSDFVTPEVFDPLRNPGVLAELAWEMRRNFGLPEVRSPKIPHVILQIPEDQILVGCIASVEAPSTCDGGCIVVNGSGFGSQTDRFLIMPEDHDNFGRVWRRVDVDPADWNDSRIVVQRTESTRSGPIALLSYSVVDQYRHTAVTPSLRYRILEAVEIDGPIEPFFLQPPLTERNVYVDPKPDIYLANDYWAKPRSSYVEHVHPVSKLKIDYAMYGFESATIRRIQSAESAGFGPDVNISIAGRDVVMDSLVLEFREAGEGQVEYELSAFNAACGHKTKRIRVEAHIPLGSDGLVFKYAPEVRFHQKETHFPASIDWLVPQVALHYLEYRNKKVKLWDPTDWVEDGYNEMADELGFGNHGKRHVVIPTGSLRVDLLTPEQCLARRPTKKKGKFYVSITDDTIQRGQERDSQDFVHATCYAHARPAPKGKAIDIQYWFFYPYNPYHKLGIGKHEGDWEHITVRVSQDGGQILGVYFAAHKGEGGWLDYSLTESSHPIVYSAKASHASYPSASSVKRSPWFIDDDIPVPLADGLLPDDSSTETGLRWRCWEHVIEVGERESPLNQQVWIRFEGQWGGSFGEDFKGAQQKSPDTPSLKDSWHDDGGGPST